MIRHEREVVVHRVVIVGATAQAPYEVVTRSDRGALLEIEIPGVDVEGQARRRTIAVHAIEEHLHAGIDSIARMFPTA